MDYSIAVDVIKFKVDLIKQDIAKLDAVKPLIGEVAINQKKEELVSCIFVLQDVMQDILNQEADERSREMMMRNFQK